VVAPRAEAEAANNHIPETINLDRTIFILLKNRYRAKISARQSEPRPSGSGQKTLTITKPLPHGRGSDAIVAALIRHSA